MFGAAGSFCIPCSEWGPAGLGLPQLPVAPAFWVWATPDAVWQPVCSDCPSLVTLDAERPHAGLYICHISTPLMGCLSRSLTYFKSICFLIVEL